MFSSPWNTAMSCSDVHSLDREKKNTSLTFQGSFGNALPVGQCKTILRSIWNIRNLWKKSKKIYKPIVLWYELHTTSIYIYRARVTKKNSLPYVRPSSSLKSSSKYFNFIFIHVNETYYPFGKKPFIRILLYFIHTKTFSNHLV